MLQISKLELAWAAGFFDGEGTTVCARHKDGCRALHITVGQVELENLTRFQASLSGLGHITGPRRLPNRQPFYVWRAYGSNAQQSVNILTPYLGRVKREQATKALLEWSLRTIYRADGFCARGHDLKSSDNKRLKDGDCPECRRLRRTGIILPSRIKKTAFELRSGMREYVSPTIKTAHEGVAWSFGRTTKDYAPQIET